MPSWPTVCPCRVHFVQQLGLRCLSGMFGGRVKNQCFVSRMWLPTCAVLFAAHCPLWVTVCKSSCRVAGGVMGTHDEETRKFFLNTGVMCNLFAREGANQQASFVNRNTTDRIFTHHQKTVRG